jgi:hypothetical protein
MSCSHGGEHEDDSLGCCAVKSGVKFTDVSEALMAFALMMEAASTSETLVNFYKTTRCNIPEDSPILVSLLYLQEAASCIVV